MNHKLRTDMLTRGELDQLDQALWHDPSAIGDDELLIEPRLMPQRIATHTDRTPRPRRLKGRR